MKIYIGTKNEKKIQLAREIFASLDSTIEVIGCSAKSEVSDTPWDEDTFKGARNRSKNSLNNPDADFGLGLETGLTERYGKIYEETWCWTRGSKGNESWGYSSGNVISENIQKRVIENKELNTKSLEVFDNSSNSWVLYSGNLELRNTCLSNAIKLSAIQAKVKG
ncbi:MAG: inosine/xanthosine triphosphatase [Patescibacteria group bacterium]|nr:inosine/xanthosine triphosphatase [Patescibacteria group bacterium]